MNIWFCIREITNINTNNYNWTYYFWTLWKYQATPLFMLNQPYVKIKTFNKIQQFIACNFTFIWFAAKGKHNILGSFCWLPRKKLVQWAANIMGETANKYKYGAQCLPHTLFYGRRAGKCDKEMCITHNIVLCASAKSTVWQRT